jgi:hypothetical protein
MREDRSSCTHSKQLFSASIHSFWHSAGLGCAALLLMHQSTALLIIG